MHKHLMICASLLLALATTSFAAPDTVIKFASLAPEGSTWNNLMEELDRDIREATNGEVGFRIYAGGVQGDEPDVLRKMRFGQIDAAGFTGNGMGEILPASRVLELPYLFRDKQEIDYIVRELTPRFEEMFREQGYELLGWAEVGYVYFFGTEPVRDHTDLKGKKVWTWQSDPLARTLMDQLGIKPVLLSLPEVLTALQTGMVDVVYTVPMAAISLQWFTRLNYMNSDPLTNTMGAVLIAKRSYDRIPEQHRQTVLEMSRKKMRELTLATRKDNAKAIKTLAASGIEMLPPPGPEDQASYRELGQQVRKKLVGTMIPAELVQRVDSLLVQYRAEQGSGEE